MDLSEFLLARIAEDETYARPRLVTTITPEAGVRHNPKGQMPGDGRRLAECDAKRRIITGLLPDVEHADNLIEGEWGSSDDIAHRLLCLLALPYADHPDYDQAWAPIGVG